MSIPDEAAFGLDMTRMVLPRYEVFCLNGLDYRVVRTIYARNCVRGHATVVYSLRRMGFAFNFPCIDLCFSIGAEGGASVSARPQSSRPLTFTSASVGVDSDELPDSIVYKLSYQPEGRAPEATLLSQFLGQFGVVDIIGFYTSTGPESQGSPFDSTAQ